MSALTKNYKDDEGNCDMVDTPNMSDIKDQESAGLLRSHELCEEQRTFGPSKSSQLTIVCLLLSNAISIATILSVLSHSGWSLFHSVKPTAVVYPPQPKWFPPQIPVTKILHGDELFGQAPNPESVQAWNSLLPTGRGWVTMKNETALPDLPGLNQSMPEHHGFLSVFHQLHCLYSTMDAYYELLGKSNKDGSEYERKRERPAGPGWSTEHLNHCWDYLRQTIMCNADVTLEWKKYGEEVGTGWGYQHQCKDWEAIISWSEENRYTNNWGILRGGGERLPLASLKSTPDT